MLEALSGGGLKQRPWSHRGRRLLPRDAALPSCLPRLRKPPRQVPDGGWPCAGVPACPMLGSPPAPTLGSPPAPRWGPRLPRTGHRAAAGFPSPAKPRGSPKEERVVPAVNINYMAFGDNTVTRIEKPNPNADKISCRQFPWMQAELPAGASWLGKTFFGPEFHTPFLPATTCVVFKPPIPISIPARPLPGVFGSCRVCLCRRRCQTRCRVPLLAGSTGCGSRGPRRARLQLRQGARSRRLAASGVCRAQVGHQARAGGDGHGRAAGVGDAHAASQGNEAASAPGTMKPAAPRPWMPSPG